MRAAGSGSRVEAAAEILLVDDDPATAGLVLDLLELEGYRVWHAPDAAGARVLVGKVRPDAVILDIMLPDESGLLLCSELRARWPAPIVLLSATRRRSDRLIGLRLGAADFIAKPFSGDELKASVEAALRRAGPDSATASPCSAGVRRIGELVIDQRRCRVALGNQEVHLTPTEYRLLGALAGRPDELLPRKDLTEQIWGYYDRGVASSLEVHMRRLRAKLNTGSVPAPQLLTVRGYGYKLLQPGGANPGRGPDDRHLGPRGGLGAAGTHPPRAGSGCPLSGIGTREPKMRPKEVDDEPAPPEHRARTGRHIPRVARPYSHHSHRHPRARRPELGHCVTSRARRGTRGDP